MVFVALWPRDDFVRWPLLAIVGSMQAPLFVPYLGRKACPLMLPLSPQIAPAVDPAAALETRAAGDRGLQLLSMRPAANPVVTLDAADARQFGLQPRRVELRRDALASRQRWQFNLREEAVL